MICECGNITKNKNGICNTCRAKIRLLNQIRRMVETNQPKTKKKKKKKTNDNRFRKTHSTLCWKCEKACGRCSWSDRFEPVDGWSAVPTKILVSSREKENSRKYTDSFDVYYCPEFELLEMLK